MKQYATVMCTVSVNDTHGMEILAMWDGTRKFDDSSTPAGKKHDIMFIPLKDYNVNVCVWRVLNRATMRLHTGAIAQHMFLKT